LGLSAPSLYSGSVRAITATPPQGPTHKPSAGYPFYPAAIQYYICIQHLSTGLLTYRSVEAETQFLITNYQFH